MAIQLIDKIKQKNDGAFKLVDAADIEWGGFKLPQDAVPDGVGDVEAATPEDIDAIFAE